MQTSLTKDDIASSYDTISPMTLWEMTRLPADDQTFGSGPVPQQWDMLVLSLPSLCLRLQHMVNRTPSHATTRH